MNEPKFLVPDLHLTARLYVVIARESRDELRALLDQAEKLNAFVGHALPRNQVVGRMVNDAFAWPAEHVKDMTGLWRARIAKGQRLNDVPGTEWPWHAVWVPTT